MKITIRLVLTFVAVILFPAAIGVIGWMRVENPELRNLGLLATFAVAVLATSVCVGVLSQVGSVARLTDQLGAGDLTLDLEAGDGPLLHSFRLLARRLQSMVGGLTRSSDGVSMLSRSLSSAAGEISVAAANQSEATEMGGVLVEKMGLSIDTVAASARAVGDEVANASTSVEEMSASNETVVHNTEKLAAGVTENLALVHQLALSIEQVAASAIGAGTASESAVQQAREGGQAVRRAGDGVEQLSRTMAEIAKVNRTLAGSSERINYVVEVIEEIAKKTKLLALNASLQATHAGEHGRAFRAVAVEVKALAERSAGSAKEIGALIEDVQKAIREAETISQLGTEKARESVRLAKGAGGTLGRVVDTIQDVSDNMLAISNTTREQAAGSEHLVATFERMQQMTDEVAAATRQQRLGGQQILEAMKRLRGIAAKVGEAIAEHGNDGRQVRQAMATIADISAENLSTAGEIANVTGALESQAAELRELAETFGQQQIVAGIVMPPGASLQVSLEPQEQS